MSLVRRRPSKLVVSLAVGLWALGSVVAIIVLPIWVSVLYVAVCGIAYAWWSRRVNRRRAADLADSIDLIRPGDQPRSPDRPSGGVHGRHSWSRPD